MAADVFTEPSNTIFPEHKPTEPDGPLHRPLLVTQTQSQTVEAVKDLAVGSLAGVLGKYVEYPFDTVKVRLQSHPSHQSSVRLHGPLDAFAQAWRAPEGPLKNLYRGISAPLLGAAIETSSLFLSYRIAQDLMVAALPSLRSSNNDHGKANLPLSALLVCGAASGAFTSLLLTPIELIKCKMQVSASSSRGQPLSPVQLVKQIFTSQGILGFWHGQLGTLIRETGGSAAWFGSYEGVKMVLERYSNAASLSDPTTVVPPKASIATQLFAGAIAGVSYNFFFYPADTIKSRMQTEQMTTTKTTKSTFLTTTQQLWRESGPRGFYRGCGITVFRAAPSSAIIFGIYEGLRGSLK